MTALIVAVALAASAVLGWGITEVVLRMAKVQQSDGGPSETKGRILTPPEKRVEILGGGAWIGVLERLAVTGAILAGQTALIGVVVAIKGLGRWADLQSNPALTERFIIGTMTSYLVAAACGVGGLMWMGAVV